LRAGAAHNDHLQWPWMFISQVANTDHTTWYTKEHTPLIVRLAPSRSVFVVA
jgi:hypothetical protein